MNPTPPRRDTDLSWPGADLGELRPDLVAQLGSLVTRAAERLPGRLNLVLETRFAALRGLPTPPDPGGDLADPLNPAEAAAVDFAERFMLDIRSVTPAVIEELLLRHHTQEEASAILFRVALCEGMSKFERVFPGGSPR